MEHFTLLIPSETKGDQVITFQAEDMVAALDQVAADYPNVTYRLFRGKEVPKKQPENVKIPPTKIKK